MKHDRGTILGATTTSQEIARANARYTYIFLGDWRYTFQTSYVGHDGICNFLVACSLGMTLLTLPALCLCSLQRYYTSPMSSVAPAQFRHHLQDMTASPYTIGNGLCTLSSP